MKARNDANRAYRVLNLVLALILAGVFVYSALFSPKGGHPVPSGTKFFVNASTPSTGLSRSFSALIRFDFQAARAYNPHGPRIFFFFLIQLFMRVALIFLTAPMAHRLSALYIPDMIISAILFFVVFWPFIHALISMM